VTGAPPLWVWLLVGAWLDVGALAVLWPVAAPALPAFWLAQTWAFGLALMGVAWLVHAAILPALLRAPRKTSWRTLAWLSVFGAWFLGAAGLLAYIAGFMAGLCILSVADFAGIQVVSLTGSMAGGATAGSIGHAFRLSASNEHADDPWRARSDILGAAIAACMADAGASMLRAMAAVPDGDTDIPAILQDSFLAVPLGTLALLPHLLLLGLDLRRAARPTSPRISPAALPIPPA